MFWHAGGKRLTGKARRGQSIVEFTICVPVFLLFVFGIFQAVLIYKTQLALNQAAMDAAQVISAQSSDGGNNASASQADAGGLASLRAGLASVDLSNLSGACSDGISPTYSSSAQAWICANGSATSGIDIFSDDGSGNAKTNVPVNISNTLSPGPNKSPRFDLNCNIDRTCPLDPNPSYEYLTLDNHYVYNPNASLCPVDQFSLTNSLDNVPSPNPSPTTGPNPTSAIRNLPAAPYSGPTWQSCSLPWNGQPFDISTSGNQNGRSDQRCKEDTVTVEIRYNYFSASFPVNWGIRLVGRASLPLEPRQFEGSNAVVQAQVGTCS